ncbi:hypothetical protein IGI04_006941 [Brassica rapa subsp. trilocularis]|uniref:Uncharacterized protein n=1 Tax=Brassica rapa subsp. trilocularis TaxID=1813537 RepID=A0ABQ7NIC1_BRACM|nr:hypothetical protein IGI04_006941 [Brassica rapa subsp. trilocularis]
MFRLYKKSNQASKLQQDVYYPFKTVLEKKQLIFGDKKHFSSNRFDSVQKQRNQRKRQNMFDDDKKRVRNGDRPFTKVKRSNCDVLDRKTYASLEKMLHKVIFAIQQLKKKGNTNTSSAPKQQCKFSSLSNSNLKTNVFSFDKSKAVKPTSKGHSTRCFKFHRIGHYANKCQNQKPLVTLENENVETEPEKEEFSDRLPIFDDYTHEPMACLKSCEHKDLFSSLSESIPGEFCLQLTVLQPENPGSFELISRFEKDSENILNNDEFSGPLNALDIGAYDFGLGSFVSMQEGPDEEQNCDLSTNRFEEGGNDAPLSSAPCKTDMHGLIMESGNDICSLFDSYLPKHESSTHEITWRISSKKNQIKRSSDVGVMKFANQDTFSSREYGPYGSSSPHLDPYREGTTWFRQTWTLAEEWLALDLRYIKSHSTSLDDPFNPYQTRISANYHTSSNQNTRITTIKYKKSKREQKDLIPNLPWARELLARFLVLATQRRLNLIESQLEITKTENCLNALNAKFSLKNPLFLRSSPRTPYILAPRSVYAFTLLSLSRHSIKWRYSRFFDLRNYPQNFRIYPRKLDIYLSWWTKRKPCCGLRAFG